jgi:hypothetical protein
MACLIFFDTNRSHYGAEMNTDELFYLIPTGRTYGAEMNIDELFYLIPTGRTTALK